MSDLGLRGTSSMGGGRDSSGGRDATCTGSGVFCFSAGGADVSASPAPGIGNDAGGFFSFGAADFTGAGVETTAGDSCFTGSGSRLDRGRFSFARGVVASVSEAGVGVGGAACPLDRLLFHTRNLHRRFFSVGAGREHLLFQFLGLDKSFAFGQRRVILPVAFLLARVTGQPRRFFDAQNKWKRRAGQRDAQRRPFRAADFFGLQFVRHKFFRSRGSPSRAKMAPMGRRTAGHGGAL